MRKESWGVKVIVRSKKFIIAPPSSLVNLIFNTRVVRIERVEKIEDIWFWTVLYTKYVIDIACPESNMLVTWSRRRNVTLEIVHKDISDNRGQGAAHRKPVGKSVVFVLERANVLLKANGN